MNYALSGGHQKTIEAAEIILNQGGNAVDAAIAAYCVSFVSEPCMASIGAGGFAMINNNGHLSAIDFFCQTPIQKRPIAEQEFYPVTVDFGNTKEDFHVGLGSIAVPGAIAGMYKMHELMGSLPMKIIMEPAVQWAKEGIKLDNFQAYDFTLLKDIFSIDPTVAHLFFKEDGTLKKEGDSIQMSQYADFLEVLSYEGKDLFYKGEIAKRVSADMQRGGHLTRTDFEQYQAVVRKPIDFKFMGHTINTVGFPSVGGMILTSILNILQDKLSDKQIDPLSIEHFQTVLDSIIEVKRLNNEPTKIAQFLIDNFGIHAYNGSGISGHKWGGTSHFNVIDTDGLTVSLTTSIGEGSGYFIPGTDMQMNNMLGEEALMPNGFHNWTENVRLQSMMSPTIITSNSGKTMQSLGSGGAGRIPYALAQSILYGTYFNLPALDTVEKPRIYVSDNIIECESGFDIEGIPTSSINIWEDPSLYFGGVNLISLNGKHHRGYADQRRRGSVINSF